MRSSYHSAHRQGGLAAACWHAPPAFVRPRGAAASGSQDPHDRLDPPPGFRRVSDVFSACPLDPPRGPVPARVRVEQQRDHLSRVTGSAAGRAQPIRLPEPVQIHRIDRAQHRPHQMILRQPLAQRRRHQQHLPTLTTHEFSSHTGSPLNPPDSTSAHHPRRQRQRLTAEPRPYFLSQLHLGSHGVHPSTVRRSRCTSAQSSHNVAPHTTHKTTPIHHTLEPGSRPTTSATGPTVPAIPHTT
jgi:hypothetical protein